MTVRGPVVAVTVLVVLAGCSIPLGNGPTPSATPTTPGVSGETPTGTAESTPTPSPDPYPPGVDEEGVANASALLVAHDEHLDRTGYVAVGSGNTTVRRSGFLINVTRSGRTIVAAGSERYYEVRRTMAGPVDRIVERYSNGTVEIKRHAEDGDVTYDQRRPRPSGKLAKVDLLEPLLLGGDFRVSEILNEDDEAPTILVLRTNETDNASALLDALPADGERVRSYNATARVDSTGRVRSLNASIGFVIGGENRTHQVTYNLTGLGVTNVTRPDWVDERNESASLAGDP